MGGRPTGPRPAGDAAPEGTGPPGGRPDPPPGAGAPSAAAGTNPACDLCGAPMYELHCKIVCGRCGYVRDCSDP